jgi:DNA-binding transcriptional regulator YbjK
MTAPDRKTLIADAAIALLGTVGAKGLTHRAVDAAAGLPTGSTSFYCRTRRELLDLTLKRHAALDLMDLQADAAQMLAPSFTLVQFIDLLAARLAAWTSPARHTHLVARFQLILMATLDPILAEAMAEQRHLFLTAARISLERLGVTDAAHMAARLVVAVDGILLDDIQARHAPLLCEQQRRQMMTAVLGGVVSNGEELHRSGQML